MTLIPLYLWLLCGLIALPRMLRLKSLAPYEGRSIFVFSTVVSALLMGPIALRKPRMLRRPRM